MGNYRKHPSAMVSVINYNDIPIPDNYDLNDMPIGSIKHRQGFVSCIREGVKNAQAIIATISINMC